MIDTLHRFSPRPDKALRRGRRITCAAAAAGCLVVAGLLVLHWSAVRDHVEVWWFVATRETEILIPGGENGTYWEPFSILAASTGRPVIFNTRDAVSRQIVDLPVFSIFELTYDDPPPDPYERLRTLSGEALLDALRQDGFRILEQRFPRAAYVVVRY